jgi:N-acetylglucosamine transport system substrate-binding protein
MSVSPEVGSSPEPTPDLTRRTLLRRAAAAGLLATPAASFLAACAGSSSSKSSSSGGTKSADNPLGVKDGSSVGVVVFNGGLGTEYAEYDKTNIFAKKHPKVTVNMSSTQKIKTEQQPKFSTTPSDLINNSGADMMAVDTLVNDGALTDLTPLLDATNWEGTGKVRDDLLPGTVDDGSYNGTPYVLNYAYTVWGMWINPQLFDKNGWTPPKTFDEFNALAPKIKAAGIAPITFAGKYPYYSRWMINSWIWKVGGKQVLVDIDNLKPNAWKADAVGTALAAVEKMVKDKDALTGSDTLSHTESQQAWIDGKAAFIPVGTWLKNEMAKTTPAGFQMKLVNFWSVTSADKAPEAVFAGSGEGWIVAKKAANAAAGMEFLRAMLSVEGSQKFAELTSSLSSRKGSGDKASDPSLTSANDIMKNATGDLVSWKYDGWYADLDKANQNAIGELMAGRMTAAKFQDTMQQAADKIAADSSVKKFTRS